eukprot:gene2444-2747_t
MALRDEVVAHLNTASEALLVVEEYDKLDCAARGLWRQLLQHPERANITSNRAIILLESNLGMAELEEMLTQLGDRSKWRASQCESYQDTLKLMSLIDLFLPYLPLQRQHLPQLVNLALQERHHLLQQRRISLRWQSEVPLFIAGQVQFSGPYPLDGAKVIDAAVTRLIARPIRQAVAMPGCSTHLGCTLLLSVNASAQQVDLLVRNNTQPSSRRKAAASAALALLKAKKAKVTQGDAAKEPASGCLQLQQQPLDSRMEL